MICYNGFMPCRKVLLIFCLIFIVLAAVLSVVRPASADQLTDITNQINDLKKALDMSVSATTPLESQVASMQQQVTSIKNQIWNIEQDITTKKKQINDGYTNLAQKEAILNATIRDYYIKSYYNSPLLIFFSGTNAAQITQILAYQRAKTNQDKSIITNIALTITDLEAKKQALQHEEVSLASAQTNLDAQTDKLSKIIAGAKAYQATLTGQIADLSSQQQAIINARSGSFTATIGDSDLADDINASITGFRNSAPSGYFAVFSFGAYTHRKGMSQYGAFGRASRGQDYHAILKAYYGKDVSTADTSGSISVDGIGSIDFETQYLYGIAEMPSSFPTEALKAQAVAARTYAYRYKQQGQSICATESCQVYSASKAANPPAEWKAAVDATKGQIIDGVVTYFSSTSGGYLDTMGWDTTDGQGGSNFADNAYEKIAGSPWFYKAWYTKGYSVSSDKCGRSNPWLSPEEMADIVNAAIALKTPGVDTSRITPITTSCWGGNPYSMDELRNLVAGHGGISSATSVTTSEGNGTTNSVTINGVTISGSDFKTAFDLRAPGYLSIPQSGFSFFNIEQK